MVIALGQLLIRDKHLQPEKLEDAYQRQVLYGGQIDTVLLEMGLVEEETILKYMAKRFDLDFVPKEDLDDIAEEVLRLIPKHLAERYRVVPFALDRRRLSIASCRPLPVDMIDDLSFTLSLNLVPHMTTELRISVALSRYYNLPLKARCEHLLAQLGEALPGEDLQPLQDSEVLSSTSDKAWTVDEPALLRPMLEAEPSKDASEPVQGGEWKSQPASEIDIGIDEIRFEQPAQAISALLTGGSSSLDRSASESLPERLVQRLQAQQKDYETRISRRHEPVNWQPADVIAELALARSRDDIIEILLRYAAVQLQRVAVFVIIDGEAVGWDAMDETVAERVRRTRLAPGRSRTLDRVIAEKTPWLGPIPAGDPLREVLGEVESQRAMMVPILVRQRLIGVFIGDHAELETQDENTVVDGALLTQLQSLMPQISLAFEVILLRRRQAAERELDDFDIDVDIELPIPAASESAAFVANQALMAQAQHSDAVALDIFAELLRVPTLKAVDLLFEQIETLEENDPQRREMIRQLVALGPATLPSLARSFPGYLRYDLFGNFDHRPDAKSLSALCEVLVCLGDKMASPVVVGALHSEIREQRAAAIIVLGSLDIPAAQSGLCHCLLDVEARVAYSAADFCTARGRKDLPKAAEQSLHKALASDDMDLRARAIRAARASLDRASIPELIKILDGRDKYLVEEAHQALREISKHDLPASSKKWRQWWQEHGQQAREQWLIDALTARDRDLQEGALRELQTISGQLTPLRQDASKAEREALVGHWRSWWAEQQAAHE